MNTEELLEERGQVHGDFTNHARITQELKRVMTANYKSGLTDIQEESLEMIGHKIGRILAGNANHQDHWDDIAGYAKLVSQRLSPPLSSLQVAEIKKIADRFKPQEYMKKP